MISVQERIDAMCETFVKKHFGEHPNGRLLGELARCISIEVGQPVIVMPTPAPFGGLTVIGYVLPPEQPRR